MLMGKIGHRANWFAAQLHTQDANIWKIIIIREVYRETVRCSLHIASNNGKSPILEDVGCFFVF